MTPISKPITAPRMVPTRNHVRRGLNCQTPPTRQPRNTMATSPNATPKIPNTKPPKTIQATIRPANCSATVFGLTSTGEGGEISSIVVSKVMFRSSSLSRGERSRTTVASMPLLTPSKPISSTVMVHRFGVPLSPDHSPRTSIASLLISASFNKAQSRRRECLFIRSSDAVRTKTVAAPVTGTADRPLLD